ncbi:uncharacterized protein LOC143223791 isoform X4 [Tachypleus tridentatus]|uniref:uncharacterized protein LOC143223791 isoform X4 n=1 Tax=Tachypleus tridentatus TaxID=6853 RepID=UPI003FD249ED
MIIKVKKVLVNSTVMRDLGRSVVLMKKRNEKERKKRNINTKRKRKEQQAEKKLGTDTAENLDPIHHHPIVDEVVHVFLQKRIESLIQENLDPLHRHPIARSGSRFSTEENRKFDSRNMSPPRKEKVFDLREKIDKARLLEVARQNVLKMIETGTLPKYIPVERLKHEQLVAIKAGGKSVAELTEFCKNLAHNENAEISSSEEEKRCQILDSVEEDRDTPFIRHPFKLKDTIPSIKLNIRNAVQVPVKTPAERVEESARLRQQFPVSSGERS